MKNPVLLSLPIVPVVIGIGIMMTTACGGKMTKEERQKVQEGIAGQEIRRVTDAELHEAAMRFGSDVMRDIERIDKYLLKKHEIDSLAVARGIIIMALAPGDKSLQQIEQKLVEAYIAGAAAGNATDNLQSLGTDTLLFTRPVFRLHPDGSQEFIHAIGIRVAKGTIVLSMPKP